MRNKDYITSTRLQMAVCCQILMGIGLFSTPQIAAAADTVYNSNAVEDEDDIIVGVSGFAEAIHPTRAPPGTPAICPPWGFEFSRSGNTCTFDDENSGTTTVDFLVTWVIVELDQTETCPSPFEHWEIKFKQENPASYTVTSDIFTGVWESCGLFCTRINWTHFDTYTTAAYTTTQYHSNSSQSYGANKPRYVLVALSNSSSTYPDPYWHELEVICNG